MVAALSNPDDLLFCAPAGKKRLKRVVERCSLERVKLGCLAKAAVWD